MTRFRTDVRAAMRAADHEARLRGAHRIGTEHLLLGLLATPGSEIEGLVGADLLAARAALERLDRAALASVGIQPPERVLDPVRTRGRVSLTMGTRNVIVEGFRRAKAARDGDLASLQVLSALLDAPRPNLAVDVLEESGVDLAALRTRLAAAA